jgi:AraC family transcriptional regulator, melibiose operon regulatory protein
MKHGQFGLQVWQGNVNKMLEPHQHSEIEFNFVSQGSLTYQFSGRELRVLEGQWLVFWGAWPHHLTDYVPDTNCVWLTLPLATFLRMDLPAALTKPILHNQPFLESKGNDTHLFEQWTNDGQDLNPERARILELELEARLRRLVLGKATRSTNARSRKVAPIGQAERMAQFIGEHHLEQIGLREIARVVGLNPNYAAGLFKQTFAMTILEYLTQHRVALAQRLLATTHSSVLEIAFASGFGSSSQFYVAFERATGQSPLEYRRAMGGKRN